MTRAVVFLVITLHLLTAASAIGWIYASHKYDCFNIGPCVGDIDYWIKLGDLAFVTFLASWAALLVSTVIYSRQASRALANASSWIAALLLPPIVFFAAHWLFNLGVSVSSA